MAGKPRPSVYPEVIGSKIPLQMRVQLLLHLKRKGRTLNDVARDALDAYLKSEIEEAKWRDPNTENIKVRITADMRSDVIHAAAKAAISEAELLRRAIGAYLETTEWVAR